MGTLKGLTLQPLMQAIEPHEGILVMIERYLLTSPEAPRLSMKVTNSRPWRGHDARTLIFLGSSTFTSGRIFTSYVGYCDIQVYGARAGEVLRERYDEATGVIRRWESWLDAVDFNDLPIASRVERYTTCLASGPQ